MLITNAYNFRILSLQILISSILVSKCLKTLSPFTPFPRLLLRFLSILFLFVVRNWCDTSHCNTTSLPTSSNDSERFLDDFDSMNSEIQKSQENQCNGMNKRIINHGFDYSKNSEKFPNTNKKKILVVTEFDRLSNLFPEIPVTFRSKSFTKNHGSALESMEMKNGKQKIQKFENSFSDEEHCAKDLFDFLSPDNNEKNFEEKMSGGHRNEEKDSNDEHIKVGGCYNDNNNENNDSSNNDINTDNNKNCNYDNDNPDNYNNSNNNNDDSTHDNNNNNIDNNNSNNHNNNDNCNNESNYKKKDEVEKELSIGYSELWLSSLKILVNLTHNCPQATLILMKNCDDKYDNEVMFGTDNNNHNARKNNMNNDENDEINNDVAEYDSTTNIIVVCCAALSICMLKRYEMEFEQNMSSPTNKDNENIGIPFNSKIGPRSPRYRGIVSNSNNMHSHHHDKNINDDDDNNNYNDNDDNNNDNDENDNDNDNDNDGDLKKCSTQDSQQMGTLSPGETADEV